MDTEEILSSLEWQGNLESELLTGNTSWGYGSVSRVLRDLTDSASKSVADGRCNTERADWLIREIINEARSAFHTKSAAADPDFWQNKDDFAQAAQDTPKPESWLKAYDMLWVHERPAREFEAGYEATAHAEYRISPSADNLDTLAATYLSQDVLTSSALEWAIIDALIYCETVAYGVSIRVGSKLGTVWTINGMVRQKFGTKVGLAAARLVGILFNEGIALAVIAAIAVFLSSGNLVVMWLIGIALASWRWVKTVELKKHQQKPLKLWVKMASISESLKTGHFNPRLVRHLLYKAEEKGAVYSPWVYAMLDRLVKR